MDRRKVYLFQFLRDMDYEWLQMCNTGFFGKYIKKCLKKVQCGRINHLWN